MNIKLHTDECSRNKIGTGFYKRSFISTTGYRKRTAGGTEFYLCQQMTCRNIWGNGYCVRCVILLTFQFLFLTSHSQIITTYAGCGMCAQLGDGGPAANASLGYFACMAFDSSGNMYIADGAHNRIRKIDVHANIITTIAGTGIAGFSGDNGLAINAQLNDALWVAFDKHNNLFITDGNNHRIRKVDVITGIITTVAGNGIDSFAGDGGLAVNASFRGLQDIAFDDTGNLYIVDGGNQRIRKVDTNGIVTTVVGKGGSGFAGDGGIADSALLGGPLGIAFDPLNNLFIADWTNHRVRRVDANTHIISTIAGNNAYAYNGDEIPAINAQIDVFNLDVDKKGNLYIVDNFNARIRKIDSVNIIHTVVGNGTNGFSGDNGSADSAEINRPQGIVFNKCDNLYIADQVNRRVRKVTFHPNCFPENVKNVNKENEINIYPNPAKEQLRVTGGNNIKELRVLNTIGQVLIEQRNYSDKAIINVSALSTGIYFIKVSGKNGVEVVRRFLKE